MNAMTDTPVVDLSIYTKEALIEIHREVFGTADTSKTKKWFLERLTTTEQVTVALCIDKLIADGTLGEVDDDEDDEPATPAPAAKAPAVQYPKVLNDPETDHDAALALIRILKSSKGVDADAVREIVKAELAHSPATRIEVARLDGTVHKVEGFTHAALAKTVKLASVRQNILLVGSAGCGKTALAHQVADALGLSFAMTSCSGGMSENQLTGWLLPIESGGKFAYVPAAFVKAYEFGGVFLLDEIDAADENTLLVINAALANGHMHVAQRHESPIIKRHADFVCIAAANTYGHGADMIYAGRNKLDGATLDRFRAGIVKMDYDPVLEMNIVDAQVLSWGCAIRSAISQYKLRRVMSTRVMLDFTKQKQALGFGISDFEESYFADWTRDELAKIGR